MKHEVNIGGQDYTFTGEWRIPPHGHPFPAEVGGKRRDLPPEAYFISEDGTIIGLHPLNPLLDDKR